MIFRVQTTKRDKIGTKNCEMVPIGTTPKKRDRLVSTAYQSRLVQVTRLSIFLHLTLGKFGI
jgi:hypothetical protein